jgi:predicted ArsR family transcriptional regulator
VRRTRDPPRRRAALLAVLRRDGPRTAGEVGAAVGLHPNTAREHLALLVREGYVVREAGLPAGRGRPRARYRALPVAAPDRAVPAGAVPGGAVPDGAVPAGALVARDALTRALLGGFGVAGGDPAEAARAQGLQASAALPLPQGRAGAGRQLAVLGAHLAELGFDPDLAPDGTAVVLRRCPLLDLARERPDVVCGVHLGLAQGLLARVGGPVRATALRPFTTAATCALLLSRE